jgi:hypothetical protein
LMKFFPKLYLCWRERNDEEEEFLRWFLNSRVLHTEWYLRGIILERISERWWQHAKNGRPIRKKRRQSEPFSEQH